MCANWPGSLTRILGWRCWLNLILLGESEIHELFKNLKTQSHFASIDSIYSMWVFHKKWLWPPGHCVWETRRCAIGPCRHQQGWQRQHLQEIRGLQDGMCAFSCHAGTSTNGETRRILFATIFCFLNLPNCNTAWIWTDRVEFPFNKKQIYTNMQIISQM